MEICKFLVQVKADVAAKDCLYDPLPSVEELFVFAFSADFLFPFFRTVVFRLCPRPRLKIANIPPPPPSRPLQSIHPAALGCIWRALGDLQIFGGSQSGCGREEQVRYFAPRKLAFVLSPTRCAADTAALLSNSPSKEKNPTLSPSCAASAPRSERFTFALHIVSFSSPSPPHPLLFVTFCAPFQ